MRERWVTIIETRQEILLSTSFDYPPIPIRSMDWSAVDANTYDASYEGEDESGSIWRCSPSGHGVTESEAILALFENLAEAE